MTSNAPPAFGSDPVSSTTFARHHEAAWKALDRSEFAAALASADLAMGAAQEDTPMESICALRLIQSEAHRWRADPARAEAPAREAVAALEKGTKLWCAAVGELAIVLATLGQHEQLPALGEALLDGWAPEPSGSLLIAADRVALGLAQSGRGALAEELHARIAAAPTAGLTPIARARVHQALATRALYAGDEALHLERATAAADAFTLARDLRSASFAHVAVGLAHVHFGEYAIAERALREALGLARRVNLPTLAATALQNLGPALAARGASAEALASVREALEIGIAQGNIRLVRGSRLYLARILLRAGEFEAAEREVTTVVDELEPITPILAMALAALADIHLAQHRPSDARRRAEAAFALLAELDVEAGDAHIRLVHAEALHATGNLEAARQAILEAQARLLARAAKISDPGLRAGFLERVPENARTLAAASSWGA
jgi:eukaryotic-like serine/threonine-protein kinase